MEGQIPEVVILVVVVVMFVLLALAPRKQNTDARDADRRRSGTDEEM